MLLLLRTHSLLLLLSKGVLLLLLPSARCRATTTINPTAARLHQVLLLLLLCQVLCTGLAQQVCLCDLDVRLLGVIPRVSGNCQQLLAGLCALQQAQDPTLAKPATSRQKTPAQQRQGRGSTRKAGLFP